MWQEINTECCKPDRNSTQRLILSFVGARPINSSKKPTQVKMTAVLGVTVKPRNQNPNPENSIIWEENRETIRDCLGSSLREVNEKEKDNQKKVATICNKFKSFLYKDYLIYLYLYLL